jgi:NitT/TauT family transport system substrate-binding protein
MPPQFVSNGLTTRADYISALAKDKGQFLPDGLMPRGGPATVYNVEKLAGKISGPVDIGSTYTNKFAIKANKLEGFKIAR